MTDAQDFFASAAQVAATRRLVEAERAEHYGEMADAFDLHGNPDAAGAFRQLASEAQETARRLAGVGPAPVPSGFQWPDMEDVIQEQDALHYMMRPYHVVEVAIASRDRMLERFRRMAEGSPAEVRARARHAVTELRDYLDSLRGRLAAMPEPERDWDEDLDPPNFDNE
ncbi:MAG TPA: hypothetical protein VFA95_02585 [Gammaproteobacteria bacterium]|nr:hypothetical protein [Gammaproteobacteria bacterium]